MVEADTLVLGSDALDRDLLHAALRSEGVAVRDASIPDPPGNCVAVLIEPDLLDWTVALDLASGIVLLTGQQLEGCTVVDAVRQGADAILTTDAEPGDVAAAIATVRGGGTVLSPRHQRAVADLMRSAPRAAAAEEAESLTTREREVLVSITRGESVKQTARSLGISPKTVESVQSRLFQKLGVRNRAHAVTRAFALGLVALALLVLVAVSYRPEPLMTRPAGSSRDGTVPAPAPPRVVPRPAAASPGAAFPEGERVPTPPPTTAGGAAGPACDATPFANSLSEGPAGAFPAGPVACRPPPEPTPRGGPTPGPGRPSPAMTLSPVAFAGVPEVRPTIRRVARTVRQVVETAPRVAEEALPPGTPPQPEPARDELMPAPAMDVPAEAAADAAATLSDPPVVGLERRLRLADLHPK